MKTKIFIYQVFPRLFGNTNSTNKENGTIEENGVGKFSAFSAKALSEIKKMGYTHVWFTGIIEHASKTDYSAYGISKDQPDVVKGNAGSPYAIRDYYDVDPDLADVIENRRDEFDELIKRTQKADLKIIIDFVPNHVARQYHSDAKPRNVVDLGAHDDTNIAFSPDNNFYYMPKQALELQFATNTGEEPYSEFPAKVTGNDRFDNKPTIYDWYETVKLNYGVLYEQNKSKYFTPVPDTWHKMKDILLFWASKGIDGFRCDMAEMVPVEFWNWVIPRVKSKYKSVIFIAEVYNPNEYTNYIQAGRFDYLYDKVGLYDTLRAILEGQKPASDISYCWQNLGPLQPKMLNFIENHDEQRIASDFFLKDPSIAIPGMIVASTMNTNPVMVYSGQELGERGMDKEGFSGKDGRTTIYDYWSVDSIRNWYNDGKFGLKNLTKEQIELRKFYIKLVNLCNEELAITKGLFYDLTYANFNNPQFDTTKQFTFIRAYKKEILLIITNFADHDVDVSINIPSEVFDFLKIDAPKTKSHVELFSGRCWEHELSLENSFGANIKAHSGKIFKFLLD